MGFEGRFICWGEMEIVWWMEGGGLGDGRGGEKKDRRAEE